MVLDATDRPERFRSGADVPRGDRPHRRVPHEARRHREGRESSCGSCASSRCPMKLIGVGERVEDLQPFEPAGVRRRPGRRRMTEADAAARFMRRALELAERRPWAHVAEPDGRRRRCHARRRRRRRGVPRPGRRLRTPRSRRSQAAGSPRARRDALRDARAVRPSRPDAPVRGRRHRGRRGARRRGHRRPESAGRRAGASPSSGCAGVEMSRARAPRTRQRQNRVFLTAMRERRPHVTLKAAMTLDGKIADLHGASRWITGEAARRASARASQRGRRHRRRVSGTVLRDDPELTVRLRAAMAARAAAGRARLLGPDSDARRGSSGRGRRARALIAVGADAPEERARALARTGATIVRCPKAATARVDLGALSRRSLRPGGPRRCSSRAAARFTRRSSMRAWSTGWRSSSLRCSSAAAGRDSGRRWRRPRAQGRRPPRRLRRVRAGRRSAVEAEVSEP